MADETSPDRRERYAVGYSDRVHQAMTQRRAAEVLGFFLPYLRPGMRVLDVGAGPGSITLDVAELVAPGEVIGIDIEPLQVERARALAVERGVFNARFEVGDAYALPFSDASFDGLYANAVLTHLRDPLAALKEFRRLLRPGGVVGVRDVVGLPVHEPATPLLQEADDIVRRATERLRGRPTTILDLQQRRLLLDAGFARTEAFAEAQSFGTPDMVRMHATVWAEQLNERFRQTVLTEGWADRQQLDAMVAEMRAWGARPDSFSCLFWCAAVGWVDGNESSAGG